ncbi:MAG: glycosyltransferase family 9 protein [Calothrix sp. MO_167.B12]|nr:glycosyltransferase family 9 protein [Calothrix sp. MO_167.B12]
MRVVALVPGGIGDQILFFPTLDDLKRSYPDAQIDVVVEPRSKAAYRVSKSVHEVLLFDYQDRNSLADWANLVGRLRDREYDVAITTTNNWSEGLILWLTGIPTRVGFKGKGAGFLTHTISVKTEQYLANMYHDLLKGLGIHSPCPELTVNVPTPDIDWANQEQIRLGTKDTGYVVIYGGSGYCDSPKGQARMYPVKSWKQIIQDFQQKQPDLPLVLIKGPNDEAFIQSLLSLTPNIKVSSPDDMGKLAAIIAGANLMLCTHSPALHLGVGVQTYTLALFGPTDPEKLLPQSDKFLGIKSPTGKTGDIAPITVLEKVWGG